MKPMDSMILQVCAGLGNRLRALVSGICVAEELGRSIRILWPKEPACGSTFAELFDEAATDFPPWIRVYDSLPLQSLEPQMCLSPADWDKIKTTKTIAIKSYGKFTRNDERFTYWLRRLTPHKALTTDTFRMQIPVGVHLRRGDHTKCIMTSPIGLFIDAMRSRPDTKFFVASDSEADHRMLESRFPGRILRAAKTLERGTQAGMADAMKDFIGLSRCSEILGSDGSSFSEMAAAYGGIPLLKISNLK
jgi:hypothetical protein